MAIDIYQIEALHRNGYLSDRSYYDAHRINVKEATGVDIGDYFQEDSIMPYVIKTVQCPCCNRTLSTQAYECPACGHVLVSWDRRSRWSTAAAQVIVFPVLAVAMIAVLILLMTAVGGCH